MSITKYSTITITYRSWIFRHGSPGVDAPHGLVLARMHHFPILIPYVRRPEYREFIPPEREEDEEDPEEDPADLYYDIGDDDEGRMRREEHLGF
ncbi:hypothetical protein Tco_0573048 [Tanacetum coccineum]